MRSWYLNTALATLSALFCSIAVLHGDAGATVIVTEYDVHLDFGVTQIDVDGDGTNDLDFIHAGEMPDPDTTHETWNVRGFSGFSQVLVSSGPNDLLTEFDEDLETIGLEPSLGGYQDIGLLFFLEVHGWDSDGGLYPGTTRGGGLLDGFGYGGFSFTNVDGVHYGWMNFSHVNNSVNIYHLDSIAWETEGGLPIVAGSVTSVPEPGSLTLVSVGFLALGSIRRRSRPAR